MSITIALAGNPNSGKTTLFNALTGSSQYVGNWPGVTVEKKEGRLKGDKNIKIQDLPGIYSLSPYTLEEVVTRNYLIHEQVDVIVNIVDATNMERNLYLTTQLIELGLPVVIALNQIDIIRKNNDSIELKLLEKAFGCPVVELSALKGIGLDALTNTAVSLAQSKNANPPAFTYSDAVESALAQIASVAGAVIAQAGANARWYCIKLFERDEKVLEQLKLNQEQMDRIEDAITAAEAAQDDSSEGIITVERYQWISGVVSKAVHQKNAGAASTSDKIDRVVTNRIVALPIFAAVMFLVYFLSISTIGGWMTDWVNEELFEEMVPGAIEGWLEAAGTSEWLSALVLDGIIAGVGAVLGFLPQMLVLFLCLAILEDCGYMARIAFIMDRIFRRFGLSGKSFIPILIGTGCGVPGIMASRTIENESDRRMTVITTTFIPCGAKLPIIALIAGAFFGNSAWIASSAYFLGISAIIISGIMLKKTRMFAGDPAPFVMELPAYHIPGVKGVLKSMMERGGAFVKKAGSIVLLSSILIWFLSSFDSSLQMVDTADSLLASIGGLIAPIFAPLGWPDWRAAVATITGLIAKENVVGAFGVLFGFTEVAEDGVEIWPALATAFSPIAAYSFLAFNLLCAPCFAAIGAVRREMMSARWTWFALIYQTLLAYCVSLVIYQMGMLFSGGSFGIGTVFALLIILITVVLLVRKPSTLKEKHSVPVLG